MATRKFSKEFQESAVKLVQEQGYTLAEATRFPLDSQQPESAGPFPCCRRRP